MAGHRARVRAGWAQLLDWIDRWLEEWRWHQRHALGPRGEQIAARYLRHSGYRILARNFHAAGAEIDLVATDNGALVFVEVKARSGEGAGLPQEAVDLRKQQRIRRAAVIFASRNRVSGRPIRFDVVAITGSGRTRRLELLKDAF